MVRKTTETLVAKPAPVAKPVGSEHEALLATLLEQLPEVVSFASDGMLIRSRGKSRTSRAVGRGLKGRLLQAIFVRLAAWMAAEGCTGAAVRVKNADLADHVAALVGAGAATELEKSEQELVNLISDFAYDWRNALKETGIAAPDIEERFDVTFHCSGGDGATLFWFDVRARNEAGVSSRIIDYRPGEAPPLALSDIVTDATLPRRRVDVWYERLLVAYRRGDPLARQRVAKIKALLAIIVITALIALTPTGRQALASALRWIRGHFTRPVINEQWRQPPAKPTTTTADEVIRDTDGTPLIEVRHRGELTSEFTFVGDAFAGHPRTDPRHAGDHVEYIWQTFEDGQRVAIERRSAPVFVYQFARAGSHRQVSVEPRVFQLREGVSMVGRADGLEARDLVTGEVKHGARLTDEATGDTYVWEPIDAKHDRVTIVSAKDNTPRVAPPGMLFIPGGAFDVHLDTVKAIPVQLAIEIEPSARPWIARFLFVPSREFPPDLRTMNGEMPGISYGTQILTERVPAEGIVVFGDGSQSTEAFVIAHPGKTSKFAHIFEHRYARAGTYRVFIPLQTPANIAAVRDITVETDGSIRAVGPTTFWNLTITRKPSP